MAVTAEQVKALAGECGFELAGFTAALPSADFSRFQTWQAVGRAAEMHYLTDHRGDLRRDPRHLLPEAQTVLCVGKLYNTPHPPTSAEPSIGWISRYAWGADYHGVMWADLTRLAGRIAQLHGEPFAWRACVDSAPLLERSYARLAGLGWIGKNTCLINQERGSWFFLGELLLSLPFPADLPAPERCGTCRRCIDACPTSAIVPDGHGRWSIDARLCISYLTIEKRGVLDPESAKLTGNHIFGCDICQDICPWNRSADVTADTRLAASNLPQELEQSADITPEQFRALFRDSPVWRAKYEGFLRNVANALGNSGRTESTEPLQNLLTHPLDSVRKTAYAALERLREAVIS